MWVESSIAHVELEGIQHFFPQFVATHRLSVQKNQNPQVRYLKQLFTYPPVTE